MRVAIDQSMGMALGKVYLPQMVTYTSKRHNAVKTAKYISVCRVFLPVVSFFTCGFISSYG